MFLRSLARHLDRMGPYRSKPVALNIQLASQSSGTFADIQTAGLQNWFLMKQTRMESENMHFNNAASADGPGTML